ncbi:unnamed protein product [Pleuronectes platessa]|uniref:Uncharacterized protein n=1 Tax=Pleuronectes platessa TaxID=8262 RepID=A0A9N7YKC1_PLEPL|nr:unnamed protein product [Pleuronectes platessa]
MSSGCWLHVCGSLLLDLSVFVYAVLHVAAQPGSSGDLAEKQSLQSGACGSGSRLLCDGLDPGCTRAAHCEAGDAPADFTQLRAGHVSPAQGSPRLQENSTGTCSRTPVSGCSRQPLLRCPGGEAEEEEGGRELRLITFVARTDLLHAPRAARTSAGHQQLVAASIARYKIDSYPGF